MADGDMPYTLNIIRSMALGSVPVAALSLFMLAPTVAEAQSHEGTVGEGTPETEGHNRWHAGVSGALNESTDDPGAHWGVGGFVEYTLYPEKLELELGVHLFPANGATVLPIDLLAKIPFELSHRVHPFVGIGPTVVPVFGSVGATTLYGGVVEGGSYFWLTDQFGLLAQAAYNLLGGGGTVVSEFQADVGVVFGW